jgi:hypothetical protein
LLVVLLAIDPVSSRSRPSSVGVSESRMSPLSLQTHPRPRGDQQAPRRRFRRPTRCARPAQHTRARVPRVPVPRRASRAPRPLGVKSQPPPEAADFAVTHRAPIGRHDGGLQPAQER